MDANTVGTLGWLLACLTVGLIGGVLGALLIHRRPHPDDDGGPSGARQERQI